ncbi:MAG: phosphatidate cytidylyltransferase [Thermodesulfobacteriota bacterium]
MSGLFLIPIVVFLVLYISSLWFLAVTFIVTLYGLWEYNNFVLKDAPGDGDHGAHGAHGGAGSFALIGALVGAFLPVCAYWYGPFLILPFFALCIVIFSFLSYISRRDGRGLVADLSLRMLGVVYVSLLLTHFLLLRESRDGHWWLLFALVIVWAGDTSAYYGGRRFGKRKLAPKISPNKTVEGAFAGIIGSMAAGVIFVQIFSLSLPVFLTLLMGALAGGAGILGDLFESYLKRRAGVKDSGRLIPGHGGLLDRIDGTLFAVPVVYYFLFFTGVSWG